MRKKRPKINLKDKLESMAPLTEEELACLMASFKFRDTESRVRYANMELGRLDSAGIPIIRKKIIDKNRFYYLLRTILKKIKERLSDIVKNYNVHYLDCLEKIKGMEYEKQELVQHALKAGKYGEANKIHDSIIIMSQIILAMEESLKYVVEYEFRKA